MNGDAGDWWPPPTLKSRRSLFCKHLYSITKQLILTFSVFPRSGIHHVLLPSDYLSKNHIEMSFRSNNSNPSGASKSAKRRQRNKKSRPIVTTAVVPRQPRQQYPMRSVMANGPDDLKVARAVFDKSSRIIDARYKNLMRQYMLPSEVVSPDLSPALSSSQLCARIIRKAYVLQPSDIDAAGNALILMKPSINGPAFVTTPGATVFPQPAGIYECQAVNISEC